MLNHRQYWYSLSNLQLWFVLRAFLWFNFCLDHRKAKRTLFTHFFLFFFLFNLKLVSIQCCIFPLLFFTVQVFIQGKPLVEMDKNQIQFCNMVLVGRQMLETSMNIAQSTFSKKILYTVSFKGDMAKFAQSFSIFTVEALAFGSHTLIFWGLISISQCSME